MSKPYQYTDCGLDNVWLLNGFTLEDTPYGTGVSIQDIDGLHKCIARLLTEKPEPLTGAEFRFLRIELDLSQRAIGELFGRDERQVRNWETGKEAIADPYNVLIRLIYQERENCAATYTGLWERLRNGDKLWHQRLQFKRSSARAGWKKAS